MEKPFHLINASIAKRKQFVTTEGKQPTLALFHLTKGIFNLTMDGKTELLTTGDTVIFPDDVSFSRSVKEKIEFVYLEFKMGNENPLAFRLPHGKIIWRDRDRFLSSINSYIKLISLNTPEAIYMKEHLLNDILLQAILESGGINMMPENAVANNARIQAATEYIHKRLRAKIEVQDVAEAALTNPTTLSYTFKKVLGISVGAYIIRERLTEGARLLRCTNYKIKEIAEKCGYDSEFYFSSAFKRFHGISPSEYKKKYCFLNS